MSLSTLQFIYSLTIKVNSIYSEILAMFEQKYIGNEQIKNTTPTNVKFTEFNVILPKNLPMRDDNVWLTSPVKISTND